MKIGLAKLSFPALILASFLYAQNTGSITGTVSMMSGGSVADATVSIENLTSGVRHQAMTDNGGNYRFDNLPSGRYRMNVSTPQITGTPSEDINFDAAAPKTVNITLQAGTPGTSGAATLQNGTPQVTAQVQVQQSVPALDTTTPQIMSPFNNHAVEYPTAPNYLEKNGSFYGAYNLSLIPPGVASNGGFGFARGPVVGGQRPISNNFYIDGVDNNNRAIPGPLLTVSNDATSEFVSFQNQFPPEWGHTGGGQFNAVVKTGTNQVHGELYDYLQNNRWLNARDAMMVGNGFNGQPRYDQNRLGANLGLPIVPNRLFFFGSFEYIPLGLTGVPTSPVFAPTEAGFATLRNMGGISQTNLGVLRNYVGSANTATNFSTVNGTQIPIGPVSFAGVNQYQNQYNGVGSLDWDINNSDQLRARYVHNELQANNDGAQIPTFFTPLRDRSLMASVAEYHNFSPVFVNELRLGYNRFNQTIQNNNVAFPGLNVFPMLSVQQDLNLQMGNGFLGNPAALNTYQLSDNVNWNRGRHVIKFGADTRRFIGPLTFANFGSGFYNFSNMNAFLNSVAPASSGFGNFSNLTYPGNNWDTYAYLNDSWQVSPHFNLNLGVSYSYTTIPKIYSYQGLNSIADVPNVLTFREPNTQKTNFAPIVGLAWSPGSMSHTVFRAGFGMNYDTSYGPGSIPSIPPGFFSTTFVNQITYYPGFFGLGAFVQPFPFTFFTPSVTAEQARAMTTTYIQDQQTPYTMQWNASIQQELGKLFVEARYLGIKAVHLPTEGVLNAVSPVSASQSLPLFYGQPTQTQLNALPLTLNSLQASTTNPLAQYGFTNPITTINSQGWSWYNGLAISARERFGAGFQGNLSYTWSHLIDNMSGPAFNRAGMFTFTERMIGKGNSLYDHRHRLVGTLLWDVGGIGSTGPNWMRDVLANFVLSGTYTYESPSSAFLQSDVDAGLAGGFASGVFVNSNGVAGTGSGVTPQYNSAGQIVGYLANNPNAQFIAAGAGTFPNSARSMFKLEPINNFDTAAYKRFALRDHFTFEVHAEAFNVLNHPQYIPGETFSIGNPNPLSMSNLLIPGAENFGNVGGVFSSHPRVLQVGLRLLF